MATHNPSLTDFNRHDVPLVVPQRMTEEEFVAWCDEDTRAEWVDGEVIMMSPANSEHVSLNVWLIQVLGLYINHHSLGGIFADLQIRFATLHRRRVPDMIFVAQNRLDLLRPAHFEGPPDLAIEIVSPDSISRDWRDKYLDYEVAGVREYWVISPAHERMEAYALDGQGKYQQLAEIEGKISSSVLAGFQLQTAWLWPKSRPNVIDALRELNVWQPA